MGQKFGNGFAWGGSASGSLGSLQIRWSWGYGFIRRLSWSWRGCFGGIGLSWVRAGDLPSLPSPYLFSSASWCFMSGASLTLGALPTQGSPLLRDSQHCLPRKASYKCKVSPVESVSLSSALAGPHTLGHCPWALTTPEQGPDSWEQLLCPRAHLSHSNQPILSLLTLPHPLLLAETKVKALVHLATTPLDLPSLFPWSLHGVTSPFSWDLAYGLSLGNFLAVCWPHHA